MNMLRISGFLLSKTRCSEIVWVSFLSFLFHCVFNVHLNCVEAEYAPLRSIESRATYDTRCQCPWYCCSIAMVRCRVPSKRGAALQSQFLSKCCRNFPKICIIIKCYRNFAQNAERRTSGFQENVKREGRERKRARAFFEPDGDPSAAAPSRVHLEAWDFTRAPIFFCRGSDPFLSLDQVSSEDLNEPL